MDRRKFVKRASAGLGTVATIKLDKMNLSAFQPETISEENDNILVVVQMFGGNDAINTITPYEWPVYYNQFRPTTHIPENLVTIISKEKGCAMHPSLLHGIDQGMYGLFQSGKMTIMQGIGYDNPNFSHFRSSDIWYAGIVPPNDGMQLPTGWMGRYFDKYGEDNSPVDPYCIQVGANPAKIFQGQESEKAILVNDPNELFEQGQKLISEEIDSGYDSYFKDEFSYVNKISLQVNKFSKVVKEAFDKGRNIEKYESENLSNQLKLVARLIDGGLKTKVYFVELTGFDTHANQGSLDGVHARLLSEVSKAISSFQSDIEKLGHSKRVVGITTSEFGRRPYENGSSGTDHGTAGVQFAFGEAVNGKLLGGNVAFLPFFDSLNVRHNFDFRGIYYEILTTWFGNTKEFAQDIVGGPVALVDNVGFLKATTPDKTLPQVIKYPEVVTGPPVGFLDPRNVTEQDIFSVYPNPTYEGYCLIVANLQLSALIKVYQYHISGINYGLIAEQNLLSGQSVIPIQLKGGKGLHILEIKRNNRTFLLKVLRTN